MNELPQRIAASVLTLPEDALAFAFALVHARPIRQDVRHAVADAIKGEVGSSPIRVAFASEVVCAWVGLSAVPHNDMAEVQALAGRYRARVLESGLLALAMQAFEWVESLPREAYTTDTVDGQARRSQRI